MHASAVVELARVSRLHITFVTVAHRDNCSRSPAYRFGVVTSPPCLEKTCLMALVARLSGLTLAPHVRILVSRHQSTWILSVEHHLDGKMPWVSSGTHSHGPWRMFSGLTNPGGPHSRRTSSFGGPLPLGNLTHSCFSVSTLDVNVFAHSITDHWEIHLSSGSV